MGDLMQNYLYHLESIKDHSYTEFREFCILALNDQEMWQLFDTETQSDHYGNYNDHYNHNNWMIVKKLEMWTIEPSQVVMNYYQDG